jgi:hypothetical protein
MIKIGFKIHNFAFSVGDNGNSKIDTFWIVYRVLKDKHTDTWPKVSKVLFQFCFDKNNKIKCLEYGMLKYKNNHYIKNIKLARKLFW